MSNEYITDEMIIQVRKKTKAVDPTQRWGDSLAFARAILALRPTAQPAQTWDANQIAMACAQAEISDGHCQSLLIALEESNKS